MQRRIAEVVRIRIEPYVNGDHNASEVERNMKTELNAAYKRIGTYDMLRNVRLYDVRI